MKTLRAMLCGLLIISIATFGASFDKKIEKQMYSATGRLYVQNPDKGDYESICTIWNVAKTADGYEAVTASHCITLADEYKVGELHFKATYDEPVDGITPPALDDITIIAVGNDHSLDDFALIDVKTNKKLPIFKLGDSDKVRAGDRVLNCSVPFGGPVKGIYTGIVSSPNLPYHDPREPEISAEINGTINFQSAGPAPGSSGSAVLDVHQGAVIGVLVMAGSIGILADPVNELKRFMALHPAPNVIAEYSDDEN